MIFIAVIEIENLYLKNNNSDKSHSFDSFVLLAFLQKLQFYYNITYLCSLYEHFPKNNCNYSDFDLY